MEHPFTYYSERIQLYNKQINEERENNNTITKEKRRQLFEMKMKIILDIDLIETYIHSPFTCEPID